jgi:hypothetical protein
MTSSTTSEYCFVPRASEATADTRNKGGYWASLDTAATHMMIDGVIAESATARHIPPRSVEQELQQVFRAARYEIFEDGVESEFSQRLVELIARSGESTLLESNALIRASSTPRHVAAEALKWLGWIRDPHTHAFRRWILADNLTAASVLVRDGAIVGLTYLNDPATKQYVIAARSKEVSAELCRDLDQLIDQLEFPEKGYVLFSEENSQIKVGSSISR